MKQTFALLALAGLVVACQETLEERAAREARDVTETKCPMPVGEEMYLDSIVFDIPTLTQTQYFRFVGSRDCDGVVPDADYARQALIAELKNTPSYKSLLQRGTSFRYVYRSGSDPEKILFETTITKGDY